LGIYAASYNLGKPSIDVIFNIVNLGSFPELIEAYEADDRKKLDDVFEKTILKITFLCLPSITILLVLADTIVTLLLPAAYREHAPNILRLISIAALLMGVKQFIFDQVFHLAKKSMYQIYTLIPAVIGIVMLNIYLIPRYGVVGAGFAAVIGALIALASSIFSSLRFKKINFPVQSIFVMLVASIAIGSGIYLVNEIGSILMLGISIFIAGIFYLFICWRMSILFFITGDSRLHWR
jgi:O-antigen/teichoic acid export membrane protein